MIRVVVFIMSLGLMISSGLLIGNRSVTATDNPANHPPSIQVEENDAYSYLASSGEMDEADLIIE
jgi:hypothetical protein